MPAVPSSLALETIGDGTNIVASQHRNNYSAIQTLANALVTLLGDVAAKGDLLVATANDVIARLPVGANDTLLVADSTQTGGVRWAPVPSVLAISNAVTSAANVTWTSVALAAESFDNDTMHDVAVNNSRITIKTAGKYLIGGNISFATSGVSALRGVRLFKNGTTQIVVDLKPPGALTGNDFPMAITTLAEFAVNDYIEIQGIQDSGGALNITNASTFWATRITA